MAEAIVSSTVSKVADLLFGKVIKEINHIRSCTENVEKFKAEVEKLKDVRGKVQQQIEIANSKGDNLITGVEEWVKKADTEISKAEEFLNEEANAKKTCFKIGLCGNWHTLYHYGKMATKMSPYLRQHQEDGKGEEVEREAHLKRVAMNVAEECGGLPLFLNAVGNALKNKSIEDWDKALTRLQEHAPTRVDPEIGKAFTRLKLSYDFLDNEARLCFLLCSLLLNLDNKRRTKMHDVVRDVALLIASEGDDKNNFLVEAGKGLTEWLPRKNELESYTGISLMKNNISKLPNYELHLPHLDIFLISENDELPIFSDELIRGMKEVRVLDMSWCKDLQTLPQSFKFLTKFRMLDLQGNKSLHDISILAEMQDLEILILDNTGIKEIPEEIGQLVNLRRLSAIDCKNLYHVASGVISKLWRLEELLIGFKRVREGIYERIIEIMNLSNLTYLALHVPRFDMIPEGFNPQKPKGFLIQIGGDHLEYDSAANLKRRHLVIKADYAEISFLKWNKQLTEASHRTDLISIENLNNILPQLYHEGFNELERIKLYHCHKVTCLIDTSNWVQLHTFNLSKHIVEGKIKEMFLGKLKYLCLEYLPSLKVLWNCPEEYISLSNLVTLKIVACGKLVKLFPVSVAQGLVNLQDLCIKFCDSLEEVIWDGDEETSISETEHSEYTVFRSLAKIDLYELERLERFYSGHSTIKYPSLVDVEIEYCPGIKLWGPGIHETPKLKFVTNVQLEGPDATINDVVTELLETEKTMGIEVYNAGNSNECSGFGHKHLMLQNDLGLLEQLASLRKLMKGVIQLVLQVR
ncbi:NB-ARC domains-containing protein [Artemisia annua]|uniref:NB-ARC domains-containing protein n=1 Tax=Artemisia annua TaxID=35608 RepID=A0A2U1L9F9_ARTAN|nr:NB-ARC domains-containing protein [Artemisia annua]